MVRYFIFLKNKVLHIPFPQLEELYDFFNSNNYAILIPNRLAHDDPGLSKEAFLEGHLYPRRTTNYFAIPRERRVEIRDRGRNILNIPMN